MDSTSADKTNGAFSEMEMEKEYSVALGEAVVKVQKAYRGYRTRRNFADSVLSNDLWWQAIDHATLNHRTISFFNSKPETAISKWNRVTLNASKVGQGLTKNPQAHKMDLKLWIEAIDPRHRYGRSLHFYYQEWSKSNSNQPFLYWLDIGDGKDVDLEACPRSKLQQHCVKYLGFQERENYEYVVHEGKFIHKLTGNLLHTGDGSEGFKWMFVMSTDKKLYIGEKKKGNFHHSSFLGGGCASVGGVLRVHDGILKFISPYSGHYLPTVDTFESFLSFLKDNGVNLDEAEVDKTTATEAYNRRLNASQKTN